MDSAADEVRAASADMFAVEEDGGVGLEGSVKGTLGIAIGAVPATRSLYLR
jgi:hypothetical protein